MINFKMLQSPGYLPFEDEKLPSHLASKTIQSTTMRFNTLFRSCCLMSGAG